MNLQSLDPHQRHALEMLETLRLQATLERQAPHTPLRSRLAHLLERLALWLEPELGREFNPTPRPSTRAA